MLVDINDLKTINNIQFLRNQLGIRFGKGKGNNTMLTDPETGITYYLRESGYVSSKYRRGDSGMGTLHNKKVWKDVDYWGDGRTRHIQVFKMLPELSDRLALATEAILRHRAKINGDKAVRSFEIQRASW
jgi:hypothetical protein